MKRCVQFFAVLVLVVFSAGTFMQPVNAATMSVKMALVDGGGADMTDCHRCLDDSDDKGPSCDTGCVISFVAVFQPSKSALLIAPEIENFSAITTAIGRTESPEPYPPRPIILN